VFDKSTIANFPSHEVEFGENTCNSSATSCHDQLQTLYGMPINTCPGQPHPPTHIDNKLADLHKTGPSARERRPSGPATVGPIFNELPRHAPEPQRTTQNLNYPVRPSAYSDGRSAYNHGRSGHIPGQSTHTVGRSAYPTGRSGAEFFEEDCYLNPHPSQQHLPSHYTMHQPIDTDPPAHGNEYFPAPPRRPERNSQSYEPYRQIVMHHITQTNGGRQHANIQSIPPMVDQRAGGLALAAIDIVREEIAGAFRDKLGVSMVPRGNHIGNLMTADLIITHTHREPGYPNSQNFWVIKEKAHVSILASF
jgi:hypothetical protein